MEPFGLDPETALKFIQMLLREAAYFFAGFALLALCTYVVFLCLEIFASQPRAKTQIAKAPKAVGCARAAEENHDLMPGATPILAEQATASQERRCVTAESEPTSQVRLSVLHHRTVSIDTDNA